MVGLLLFSLYFMLRKQKYERKKKAIYFHVQNILYSIFIMWSVEGRKNVYFLLLGIQIIGSIVSTWNFNNTSLWRRTILAPTLKGFEKALKLVVIGTHVFKNVLILTEAGCAYFLINFQPVLNLRS